MQHTLVELSQRLAAKYDVDFLVDFLKITPEELINAFIEKIEDDMEAAAALLEEDAEFQPEEWRA